MVDTLEAMLHYPLGDTLPEPGKTVELAPGVRWLRMGLPFALNHINLWLLQDQQDGQTGWTAVDCGIANDATRGHWEQIFATELQGLPLLRVVCTHMHPDHIGLASWLTERFSTPERECRLWISATDWNVARLASQATTGLGSSHSAADFFALHGLTDPEALAKVRARSNYYPSMVPSVPPRYRRLLHDMQLQIGGRGWRCIAGYGHAPEHMALYCEDLGLLISGDMVLPRISTNISVFDTEPEANPLPLFLKSLEGMRSLPAQTRVLPSHGKPFEGLHTRIDQLQDHHRDRLADVVNACSQADCSAADLLQVLFKRSLDLHQTTFAMGESVAHVHALAGQGKLQPVPGPGGVLRWRTVAAA